ncbi:MAG: low molecular weight phosphotyrosine protein phosphatase [Dysgonamonadaceae bacterium]|jgi:protein-tyrosine phosphatase|nr:low molecular weight phosphotyrosine protein phosphatase [Dysgonamonadaceae bacterium]
MKKKDKIRILFVCLGNICRSPAAEGIMKKLIEENGLEDAVEVDSAGLSDWHEGELPDSRMRSHGRRRGYDFCSRSRPLERADFERFDYIIVMDSSNYTAALSLARTDEDKKKLRRMTDFSSRFSYDHVPDPYYSGASGFELVLDLLEDACGGLLDFICTEISRNRKGIL